MNNETKITVLYLDEKSLTTVLSSNSSPLIPFSHFTQAFSIAKIILVQKLLFGLSECKYDDYSLQNIKTHVSRISNELFNYNKEGFIQPDAVSSNRVVRIFRSVFPELEPFFLEGSNTIYQLFILQHLANITLLLLQVEYKLALAKDEKTDVTAEEADFLKDLELDVKDLRGKITPGIRSELTRRRMTVYNKVYSGYDTEYQVEEIRSVDLLCFTLASYSRSYLRYIPLNIDYSIETVGEAMSVPNCISNFVQFLVKLYRHLDGKPDEDLEKLVEQLDLLVDSKELERITTNDTKIYSLPRDLSSLYTKYHTYYSEDESEYTLKYLVEKSISFIHSDLKNEYNQLIKLVSDKLCATEPKPSKSRRIKTLFEGLRHNKKLELCDGKVIIVPTKLDLTMICHYSAADICTLKDLEEYKASMSIVKKTFVTIDKPLRISEIDVHLRDTSLLTVGNSSSLASLGKLYAADGLEKIEIAPK